MGKESTLSGFLGSGFRELLRSAICFHNITTKGNSLLVQLMGVDSLLLFAIKVSYSWWETVGSRMVSGLKSVFINSNMVLISATFWYT